MKISQYVVNLKKYNAALKQFVLFLTLFIAFSCGPKPNQVSKIEGREIPVTDKNGETPALEDFIKPYRANIDKDMNTLLAYAPQTLDKSGEWQTAIGSIMADEAFRRSTKVFKSRENKDIDFCLLNHGGVRSIIPKGNVTTRTAFEIMPFENSLVVAELRGEQVMEIVNYIISEKKPHPLSGMTFTIGKDNVPKDILIQGKPFDVNKVYEVVTSDYLINGGDNMVFFKKAVKLHDLDYKLRNVLIDYFKDADTIVAPTDVRIRKE